MSLYKAVIAYLKTIREDAAQPQRIDKLTALVERYQRTPIEETRALSKNIAGFVKLLFKHMPEIEKADPQYNKLYPLYDYCENLPKPRKTPKGPRPRFS